MRDCRASGPHLVRGGIAELFVAAPRPAAHVGVRVTTFLCNDRYRGALRIKEYLSIYKINRLQPQLNLGYVRKWLI